MASMKEKMQQARELIQAKKYEEARAILKTIDHDKAYEWLDKINELLPPSKPVVAQEKPKATAKTSVKYEVEAAEAEGDYNRSSNLVCPKCNLQNPYKIDSLQMVTEGRQILECPKCGIGFTARMVFIRAKKSRKRDTIREFDVRVMVGKSEELIQFISYDTTDMELRSKDLVAFLYLDGKLAIVQNLTVGLYWKIKDSACYLATYVYGEDSEQVRFLRQYRDERLLPSQWAFLVPVYYTISPKLILWFGDNPIFKWIVSAVLRPVVSAISLQSDKSSP